MATAPRLETPSRAQDWRSLSAEAMAPRYEAEINRWRAHLGWDTRRVWGRVEEARRVGLLPGLVVGGEAGETPAWTFYLMHRRTLQVGALVAPSPRAVAHLVDGILGTDEAQAATGVVFFAFPSVPGCAPVFEQAGFATDRYLYLVRPLGPADEDSLGPGGAEASAGTTTRAWVSTSSADVAALFRRAYTAVDRARPFVRGGQPGEWLEYVDQLLTTDGCGTFLPGASVSSAEEGVSRLRGALITTAIGPATAHVAQVVVDPEAQGRGVGRMMMNRAIAHLAVAGFRQLTLLVSERNEKALRLYERLGFSRRAEFISAARDDH